MSQFFGTLQGNRAAVSRTGGKTGINAELRSSQCRVWSRLYVKDDEIHATVRVTGPNGVEVVVFDGPASSAHTG